MTSKEKRDMAKLDLQDKIFDVARDPLDGNVYLQIDPGDLDQLSPADLDLLTEQFAKHVENEMEELELQNLKEIKEKQDAKDLRKNIEAQEWASE